MEREEGRGEREMEEGWQERMGEDRGNGMVGEGIEEGEKTLLETGEEG